MAQKSKKVNPDLSIVMPLEQWIKGLGAAVGMVKLLGPWTSRPWFEDVLMKISETGELDIVGCIGSSLMRWRTRPEQDLSKTKVKRWAFHVKDAKRIVSASKEALKEMELSPSLEERHGRAGHLHLAAGEFIHPLGTCRVEPKIHDLMAKIGEWGKMKFPSWMEKYEKLLEDNLPSEKENPMDTSILRVSLLRLEGIIRVAKVVLNKPKLKSESTRWCFS